MAMLSLILVTFVLFGAVELQAKRIRCERFCFTLYKPVCGSNGKTYSNACVFGVAKCKEPSLRLVKKGECTQPVKQKIGKCPVPKRCRSFLCRLKTKRDMCQTDSQCPGRQKCCRKQLGKKCTNPCPAARCRPCPNLYKHATGRNGCPSCRCVCALTFHCFIDPCMFARCPRYRSAKCRPNYCGGCKAEFYFRGRKVNCKLSSKGK